MLLWEDGVARKLDIRDEPGDEPRTATDDDADARYRAGRVPPTGRGPMSLQLHRPDGGAASSRSPARRAGLPRPAPLAALGLGAPRRPAAGAREPRDAPDLAVRGGAVLGRPGGS